MIFRISEIANAGELKRERIILKAITAGDLGRYAILRAWKGDDGSPLSGSIPNCFWFPDTAVKSGDIVVLYTKEGEDSEKENPSGSKSYFFYWDLESPIWLSKEHTAVLVNTTTWSSTITKNGS
jgi:hypothetical protein